MASDLPKFILPKLILVNSFNHFLSSLSIANSKKKSTIPGAIRFILVGLAGLEPVRVSSLDPKSYIDLSSLWKSKAYPIGTGRKIAYLFPAQGTKKNANQ